SHSLTPSLYTPSLHDALPILPAGAQIVEQPRASPVLELDHLHVHHRRLEAGRDEHVAPVMHVDERVHARLARGGAQFLQRVRARSEEHTSELQSPYDLVCRLL